MATFVNNTKGNCRLCTEPDTKDNMVACDECDRWFHLGCAKLDHMPTLAEKWSCIKCETIVKKMAHLELELQNSKKVKEEKPGTSSSTSSSAKEQPWVVFLKRQALQQLPKFDGTPRDWPSFKTIFDSTTKAGEFSNIENLTRLSQVLEGKAMKSVRQLMMSADNVPRIMERLEESFGRSEFVYKELLNDLTKVKKNSKTAISDISDALENMVNNLDQAGTKYYLFDHRLVEETVQKLPYNLQIRWTEICQGNDNPPSLGDLSTWLLPHAKTQRLMANTNATDKRDFRVNVHEKSKIPGRGNPPKHAKSLPRLKCSCSGLSLSQLQCFIFLHTVGKP